MAKPTAGRVWVRQVGHLGVFGRDKAIPRNLWLNSSGRIPAFIMFGPKLVARRVGARIRPKIGRMLAKFGTEIDQSWPELGEFWLDLSRSWPGSVQNLPDVDQSWQHQPESANFGPKSTGISRVGPKLEELGQPWLGIDQTWTELEQIGSDLGRTCPGLVQNWKSGRNSTKVCPKSASAD